MEQMFRLLFVGLLGGLWLSLEEASTENSNKGGHTMSFCYDTSSGQTCFTTFLANNRSVRKSFEKARNLCNSTAPGSSLIIINSPEDLKIVESFLGRQRLANETVITDAQKLSSKDSLKWSWISGNATIPTNVNAEQLPGLVGACVESKHAQSLVYCSTGTHKSQYRYICEYSDSMSNSSYRQNNKSYVASEGEATWYDARNECLRLEGDLASITDLQTIEDWSQLKEKQGEKYWIGLRRNKWIWNNTGAALTYTKWEDGFPDEFSDNQCICISPQCRRINDTTNCEYDRKWRTCNCTHNYAIVCQKQERSDAVTTKIVPTEATINKLTRRKSAIQTNPPTIDTTTSTKILIAPTPAIPTTPLKPRISTVITTANALTQKPPNNVSDYQTTAFAPSPAGLFNSFGIKEILLILVLFVAVVFIIVAVILIIRKRRYGRQNEISPTKNTKQSETVSSVYATVVPDNKPSEGTVQPGNTIYAEVEMIQQPTPPISNTIYASVQPTSEAVDKGKSVVYADLDFQQKDLQKPRSADKITTSLSSSYFQPYKPPTSASNTLCAEPIYLEAIDVDPTATQDPSALYAEPMKLKTSS